MDTKLEASEEKVRDFALFRIAPVFRVKPESLTPDTTFGQGLKASFVSDFKANEYEQIDRDRRQFSYSRVASLLGAVVFVFAGMSFGADSPLEKWRSEGERHAVDEAIVTFGHASPPRGRILLVRDAGAMCAIRFNNFSR